MFRRREYLSLRLIDQFNVDEIDVDVQGDS